MKITKGLTTGFEGYEVKRITRSPWWHFKPPLVETVIKGVVEADDTNGLLVTQVFDNGDAVYTNGTEDIYLENSVKLLLLCPPIRDAFLKAGFRPKTEVSYGNTISIVNRNATQMLEVIETPSPLEAREAESVNVG